MIVRIAIKINLKTSTFMGKVIRMCIDKKKSAGKEHTKHPTFPTALTPPPNPPSQNPSNT